MSPGGVFPIRVFAHWCLVGAGVSMASHVVRHFRRRASIVDDMCIISSFIAESIGSTSSLHCNLTLASSLVIIRLVLR